eukprot:NODE_11138_length_266_cov_63.290323_g9368_i0.p3 GENE.NODE_11138_length_266_cov_63.290323_g9368_i0~~NODE_11138_length_266_cov_63.290323_g9368_i0.p3  ORF type:complete len:75 (+),score=8.73 NODE_11138_length_266_cov_63.290323_g9368_i0:23-226(+)
MGWRMLACPAVAERTCKHILQNTKYTFFRIDTFRLLLSPLPNQPCYRRRYRCHPVPPFYLDHDGHIV